MGTFGQAEVIVEFETEEACIDTTISLETDIITFIADSRVDEEFHFRIDDLDTSGTEAYIQLNSGRFQHAIWMAEQVKDYFVAKHRDSIVRVAAEINTPDSIYEWIKDEED